LGGLEWATGVPGSVGGAVFGNAGAHGGDVAHNLRMAEILHQDGRREEWPVEKMEYAYRTSALKRKSMNAVILAATFELTRSTTERTRTLIDAFSAHRHQTQPPGASMGSMFKNPPNDYAGRLIEAAGLKGTRIGSAEISPVHANFFVSNGTTRAADILDLIKVAQKTVSEKFGIDLELEIELIGEWN
jgi:UDP-N-acetylmuramate dehydrogenase